jgi:hypothetical protein
MDSSLLCTVGANTVTPFISTRFPAESCSYTPRVDKESVVCVCVCARVCVCVSKYVYCFCVFLCYVS